MDRMVVLDQLMERFVNINMKIVLVCKQYHILQPSIDLGGVVLGTLIGIGALLILPKIVNVFSTHGGVGGYYRSTNNNYKTNFICTKYFCLIRH
jgi:hypothetical protein